MGEKTTVTMGKGSRRDKLGVWDQQIKTAIYKTDEQQRPTVQHREIYLISCDTYNRK